MRVCVYVCVYVCTHVITNNRVLINNIRYIYRVGK